MIFETSTGFENCSRHKDSAANLIHQDPLHHDNDPAMMMMMVMVMTMVMVMVMMMVMVKVMMMIQRPS